MSSILTLSVIKDSSNIQASNRQIHIVIIINSIYFVFTKNVEKLTNENKNKTTQSSYTTFHANSFEIHFQIIFHCITRFFFKQLRWRTFFICFALFCLFCIKRFYWELQTLVKIKRLLSQKKVPIESYFAWISWLIIFENIFYKFKLLTAVLNRNNSSLLWKFCDDIYSRKFWKILWINCKFKQNIFFST